jgi:hypothetical protein
MPLVHKVKIVDTSRPPFQGSASPLPVGSGGLALLFGDAGVDRAVEIVVLQLAFDIRA